MSRGKRMLVNLGYKLILFPFVIWGVSMLVPEWITFSDWVPIALLSGLFIVIGVFADEIVLPLFGNIKATMQGGVFMMVVVWLSSFVFSGARVTVGGAILVGVILGIVEYGMHGWILRQQKRESLG